MTIDKRINGLLLDNEKFYIYMMITYHKTTLVFGLRNKLWIQLSIVMADVEVGSPSPSLQVLILKFLSCHAQTNIYASLSVYLSIDQYMHIYEHV